MLIIILIILFDILAYAFYGVDKQRAKNGEWRIPERVLLLLSVPGGVGALLGMYGFRHKTKKTRFLVVAWTFGLLQIIPVVVYVVLFFLMMSHGFGEGVESLSLEDIRSFFKALE